MDISSVRKKAKMEIRANPLWSLKGWSSGLINTQANIKLSFADMEKYVMDTASPYKTRAHRRRDFLQIIDGIVNVCHVFNIIIVPVLFYCSIFLALLLPIYVPFLAAIKSLWSDEKYSHSLNKVFDIFKFFITKVPIDALIAIPSSVVQCIRGITQILTYPITLLLRIPFRTSLSDHIPEPTFQERKSIKKLVAETDELLKPSDSTAMTKQFLTKNMGELTDLLQELERKSDSNRKYKNYANHKKISPIYTLRLNLFLSLGGMVPVHYDDNQAQHDLKSIQNHLDSFRP